MRVALVLHLREQHSLLFPYPFVLSFFLQMRHERLQNMEDLLRPFNPLFAWVKNAASISNFQFP